MEDSQNADKPRELLHSIESPGNVSPLQEPQAENHKNSSLLSDHSSVGESSEMTGSDSDDREVTVAEKCEDWYVARMSRLKENVEKLRKVLRDKERDYIRLENKYNLSKRKQEQLQEDVKKHSEVKLDADSEVEFLRLQLIEKDRELAKHRETDPVESEERNEKSKQEGTCEQDDDVNSDGASVDSYSGDSVLETKYLQLDKHIRRWLLYGVFGVAVCSSSIALLFGSSQLSTIAVGLWTLGLFCLWQERKELHRSMKIKHLKKVRNMSAVNGQLRQEKEKLEAEKTELKNKLTEEIQKKDEITARFNSLSEKMGEEMAKNEELAKQQKSTFEELQSERVSRRLAEQRLEEVSAQVMRAREEEELAKCGDLCKKLRESLASEQEQKEKLSRENKRLIEEIVAMNMKEEKWKMEKEVAERQVDEMKKRMNEMNDVDRKKDQKNETESPSGTGAGDIKSDSQAPIESKSEASTEKNQEELNGNVSQIPCFETEANVFKRSSEILSLSACWLCSLKTPKEVRMALYVLFAACFLILLKSVLSSKVCLLVCILSIAALGSFTYYRVSMDKDNC